MKKLSIFIIILALFSIIACEKNPTEPEYQKEVVVYGFLFAEKQMSKDHAILLSQTRPINPKFDLTDAVISNANVTLTDTDLGEEFILTESPESPGFYFNPQVLIKADHTYTLTINVEGKTITAQTTVPPVLKISTTLKTDTVNVIQPRKYSMENPIFWKANFPNRLFWLMNTAKKPGKTQNILMFFTTTSSRKTRRSMKAVDAANPVEFITLGACRILHPTVFLTGM